MAWSLVTIALVVFLYQAFLACVALMPVRQSPPAVETECYQRFAIVVPAHNEEGTIHIALQACRDLDYPADSFDVYVIADNCTDGTRHVAEEYGANVLVRNDPVHRGKGYALAHAFGIILNIDCDALFVVDADCAIRPDTLKVANGCLRQGYRVLQCNNQWGNTIDSPMSLLLATANVLENEFFYAPKSRLGLFVLLRGTGMVFHREILERFPWNATSVIEDAEYSCRLACAGVYARFLPSVGVVSDCPTNPAQLTVQRERWLGGGIALARDMSPRLLVMGVQHCNIALIDAAVSMWVVVRPIVAAQLVLTLAVTFLLWIGDSSRVDANLALAATVLIFAGYAVYGLLGFVRLRPSLRQCWLVLQLPWAVLKYLAIATRTVVHGVPAEWHRTPRESGTAD